MSSLLDRLLRPLANVAYRIVRRRARGRLGVHAIALTPERRVILVKLRYARGWRLPGGGRGEHEDPCEAGLRELREEIGMTSHGKAGLALPGDDELILVRDVQYRPRRWSWRCRTSWKPSWMTCRLACRPSHNAGSARLAEASRQYASPVRSHSSSGADPGPGDRRDGR